MPISSAAEASPSSTAPLNEGAGEDATLVFLHLWKRRSKKPVDTDALAKIAAYPWPGGVQEMQALVDHIAYRATGPCVTGRHIPKLPHRVSEQSQRARKSDGLPVDLPKMLLDLEDGYIDHALRVAKGNRKEAAELLGMARTTLVEKLRRRWARQQKAQG